ncbi:hypothetical protein [Amycolatopsis sp. H20-H5]|uniref:hypothetical protein n=1 Tax=Amycolatopsis sp. H20-H5 TaxID=3046309 RepID=UPI002DBF7423|nr:hypothetical protein [Amycolatopsis sp. H20-H5]MEC3976440.1 hypothetical protein [Amycolatopsis sp. H20-H5]
MAAQRVQRSGAPDAYAQWEPEARALAAALTGQFPASLTCRSLGTLTRGADLVAAAKAELGTVTVSRPQPEARGWAFAGWLVAHAVGFGVGQVVFGGRTWTADSGTWATTPEVGDAVSYRLVDTPPPGGS